MNITTELLSHPQIQTIRFMNITTELLSHPQI